MVSHGPFKRGPKKAVPPEIRAAIVAMYRHTSARRVAKHFGVSKPSVIAFVREAGEPVREPYGIGGRVAA